MKPIVAHHSSGDERLVVQPMLHVGSLAQARMRGGRHLHRMAIVPGIRVPRLRDTGDWSERRLMRHASRAPVLVYLNRYEGVPLEEFEIARQRAAAVSLSLEDLSDAAFRRLVPSAQDSWVVLDPACVRNVETITLD